MRKYKVCMLNVKYRWIVELLWAPKTSTRQRCACEMWEGMKEKKTTNIYGYKWIPLNVSGGGGGFSFSRPNTTVDSHKSVYKCSLFIYKYNKMYPHTILPSCANWFSSGDEFVIAHKPLVVVFTLLYVMCDRLSCLSDFRIVFLSDFDFSQCRSQFSWV